MPSLPLLLGLGCSPIHSSPDAPFDLDGKVMLWSEDGVSNETFGMGMVLISDGDETCKDLEGNLLDLVGNAFEGQGLALFAQYNSWDPEFDLGKDPWPGLYAGGYAVAGNASRTVFSLAYDDDFYHLVGGYYGGTDNWLRIEEVTNKKVTGEFHAEWWWGDFEATVCDPFEGTAYATSPAPGETGRSTLDSGTDGTTPSPTFFTGPILVELAQVTCNAADQVRYYVETQGWTSSGVLFAQETGNAGPQWADEHDLDSFEFDAFGSWDHLEQDLATGATVSGWQPNQDTVFTCAAHFEATDIMSYAASVFDLDGNFADCLAWGHDPSGMAADVYQRVNDPIVDLSTCVFGVTAR